MFSFVDKHKIIIKIVLALIMLPFIFFGLDSYFHTGASTNEVATVDGTPVSQQEFKQGWDNHLQQLRQMVGNNMDVSMFDTPEARKNVVEDIVNRRLLGMHAQNARLIATDAQVAQQILAIPAFQENGKFSKSVYESVLKNSGLNQTSFENNLRSDLLIQNATDVITRSSFIPKAVIDSLLKLSEQQRELSVYSITPDRFTKDLRVDEKEIQAYYDKNKERFKIPEQAKLEYVVFSLDQLAKTANVSAEEVKKRYEANQAMYGKPEERQASHILINAAASATDKDKAAAKEKAEKLFKEAQQSPAKFAELAKQNSQDPGSAEKGGDLGYFGRGMMVKPFEEAVFAMKEGEIKGPIQSDFGFHIIKLTGVKPATVRPLDSVKADIESALRKESAQKVYVESVETFQNMAYEQQDSYKPVADKFGLEIKTSDWVARTGTFNPILNAPKLLEAVFAGDSVKNRRNSEAVEVTANTMVSARVVDYKPASYRTLAEAKAEIEQTLRVEKAAVLATQEGEKLLKEFQQGKAVELTWSKAELTSRSKTIPNVDQPLLEKAFKANADKLPVYVGAKTNSGGYSLVRVSQIKMPDSMDDAKREQFARGLIQGQSRSEFNALISALRKKYEIKLFPENYKKKES